MKPINTSTFDFPTLINKGAVYVDKTAQIYELVKPTVDSIYFLSRPRRFGKSLLISTLKALFSGRRELFRGLAIEQKAWDWEHEIYPVLHLDMSIAASVEPEVFEQNLNQMICNHCEAFGIAFDRQLGAAMNFDNLLFRLPSRSAGPGKKYVLLIDEYDSPISGLLDTEEKRANLEKIRTKLHEFYIKAKAHSSDMRFLMVTGVSKFAKTSIFSAFNNPVDLSFNAVAADLVGYTHDEMENYFHEHIQAFADEAGMTYEQMFELLLEWYDSYQFSPKRLVKVVNPVSLGRTLMERDMRGWWEATAGSTLIYDALKSQNKAPQDLATEVRISMLDSSDALLAPTQALLYQSGYLTIDERIDSNTVKLKIPNNEVRQSLEHGYIRALLGKDFEISSLLTHAEQTAEALKKNGYTEEFQSMLQVAYSKLPHDWVCKGETEVKRYFLAFMLFAHAEVAGEPQHATGRPDAVLHTQKGIYIFEFKYNKSANEAIKQCYDRNYAAIYAAEKTAVFYVGINYNSADNVRTIDDVRCEKVDN